MAKSRKPADYFEPWRAEPRRVEIGDEPFTEGLDPELAERARDAHRRAAENAGYVVWGARMGSPGPCTSLLGKPVSFNSEHIVLVVRNPVAPEGCKHKARDIAERVAECVTACRAVADPLSTLDAVRDLLRDLASGASDADDPRVVGLLARMLPANQVDIHEE